MQVMKGTATFSDGMFEASHVSNILNKQWDDGPVSHDDVNPIGLLLGTYTQTGNKVDITFDQSLAVTWYASKDGSTIHGSSITHSAFGPPGQTPGF